MAQLLVRNVDDDLVQRLKMPTAGLVSLAFDIAAALRQPAYDCCDLAAAQVYGCTFVTADARLVRRAALLPDWARSTRLLWQ